MKIEAELQPVDRTAIKEEFNTSVIEVTRDEVRSWMDGNDPFENGDFLTEFDKRQGEDGTSYVVLRIVKDEE